MADQADQDDMISQFTNLTNVDVDRARFFLESSAWQLEVALASYYEGDDVAEEPSDSPEIVAEVQKDAKAGETTRDPKTAGSQASARYQTLAGLEQQGDSSSDEEEGQAFYAGGSEHSGQQILGPSKKKKDFVSEMFKSVREAGAEVVERQQGSSGKKSSAFGGTGYRLGQNPAESEVVPSTSARKENSPVQIVLKMWKTGFSVDNGPLREYTDPSNMEFLKSVRLGEIPTELLQQANGREVHLDMEDHRHEDFIQSKQRVKAFAGKGHVLGSPAPTTVAVTQPASEKDRASNEQAAIAALATDTTQPTTTVQVRLADGSRLAGTFNHTHTVSDLRNFINIARPEFQLQNFQLRTTFPSAELSDGSKSLKEAGLLNAAVLQRLV